MALDTKVYTRAPTNLEKWWNQRLRWNIGGLQTFSKYFHLFFNKNFKSVGMLLLPLFSISYILTFIGFVFLTYIISKGLEYIIGAYVFGFNPLALTFTLIPDMFLLLSLFSALLALVFMKINFGTMDRIAMFPKKLSNFMVYIFIYILIFPINLVHSTLKFLTGKYKW